MSKLVLLLAGAGLAGGALAARVAELQIFLVPVSAALLGAGYYFAYWRNAVAGRQRVLLLVATPLTLLFWVVAYATR